MPASTTVADRACRLGRSADSAYSDAQPRGAGFDKTGSTFTLLRAQMMSVSGAVAEGMLVHTTVLSDAQLHLGHRQRPAEARSRAVARIRRLSCTAPTIVRLSGNAMKPRNSLSVPHPGFDGQIHYRASARFNAASAVLDTRVASEASSTMRSTTMGATVNGSMSVDVNLLAGKPSWRGLSATLTISVDRAPNSPFSACQDGTSGRGPRHRRSGCNKRKATIGMASTHPYSGSPMPCVMARRRYSKR